MTDQQTIVMISCPYCDKSWCREDTELVCKNCESALATDLAVADLTKSIKILTKLPIAKVELRTEILISVHQALGQLIKKAKPKL